jgi:hypothetical protein
MALPALKRATTTIPIVRNSMRQTLPACCARAASGEAAAAPPTSVMNLRRLASISSVKSWQNKKKCERPVRCVNGLPGMIETGPRYLKILTTTNAATAIGGVIIEGAIVENKHVRGHRVDPIWINDGATTAANRM